jgi:NAD(P)H-flavin reductase
MYKIVKKQVLAPQITRFSVEAPEIARSREPGQFVVIRADETSERVPLTIVDSDPEKGTIDLIIQQAGFSTTCIVCFEVGDSFLDVLGPLGRPTDMEKYGTVVCVGGGVGTAVLFPIVIAWNFQEHRFDFMFKATQLKNLYFNLFFDIFSDQIFFMKVVCFCFYINQVFRGKTKAGLKFFLDPDPLC